MARTVVADDVPGGGATAVRFGILGPLEARDGRGVIALGGPRSKHLLALLLLGRGSVVSTERLVADLWGDAPPREPQRALRTCVSDIRKRVGDEVIEPHSNGYRIDATLHVLDAQEFESVLGIPGSGRSDPEARSSQLTNALALWRGPALVDFAGAPWAAPEARRLEELRLVATEQLIDARMALGMHAELVAELDTLVDRYPLRERFWAQLLLTLYRCGRQADALAACDTLRDRLHAELSIEPSRDVVRLQRAIRMHDPMLDWMPLPQPAGSDTLVLPSGVVSFLLTDVEGSTRLWERDAFAMAAALRRHDEIMHCAVAAQRGVLLKARGEGDSTFSVFARATDAVGAAVDAQRAFACETWPRQASLHVRMAIHTGEAIERDGDYFGPTVNRAARLRSTADADHVVLSRSTAELVRADLPPRIALVDVGERTLRDIARPERVFELSFGGTGSTEQGQGASTSLPRTVPASASSFVGRSSDVHKVDDLGTRHRLVTIVGAGGIGKTRLALEVVRQRAPLPPDGVVVVELDRIGDADRVVPLASAAFALEPEPGRTAIETLVAALASRRLILVLDNCEHVLDEVARLVERLLRDCPGVAVLTTSREPLGVPGEQLYRLGPLPVPGERVHDTERLREFDAIELFVQRAVAHDPTFVLDEANADAVASICRHLDGLPLALELASARLPFLSPLDVEQRLGERFRLLTTGSRTSAPRQRTLRSVFEWSYDLLSSHEREAFPRLSVFVGDFSLEGAAAVACDGGRDAAGVDALDVLAALADKSLIETGLGSDGGSRYRMLETIREFAHEKLLARSTTEAHAVVAKHLHYYRGLAEQADEGLMGESQRMWLARVDDSYDNIRVALQRVVTSDDPREGLLLARAMYRYWSSRHSSEGITMLRRLAAVAVPEPLAPLRAEVLDDLGALLLNFGEPEEAREPLTAALTVARSGHDPKLIGQVLADLAECSRVTGELVTALELADEALEHFQQASYERGIAAVLARRGLILSAQGDFVTARRAYERCLDALSASESDVLARAEVLHNLAIAELAVEEHDAAVRHLDEAFGIAEDTDDAWGRAVVSCTRALIHVLDGEPRPARSRYAESIVAARDQPIPWLACYCLLGFALVASLEGHDQRAATLLGACDAHTERLGLALEPVEARLRRSETDRLTRSLGSATFDECYREGTKFDLQRAVAFALGTDVADERSAKDPLPD